jgi:hypothetical protein
MWKEPVVALTKTLIQNSRLSQPRFEVSTSTAQIRFITALANSIGDISLLANRYVSALCRQLSCYSTCHATSGQLAYRTMASLQLNAMQNSHEPCAPNTTRFTLEPTVKTREKSARLENNVLRKIRFSVWYVCSLRILHLFRTV